MPSLVVVCRSEDSSHVRTRAACSVAPANGTSAIIGGVVCQVRAGLDDLLKDLRGMPPVALTSKAWIHANDTVKAYKAAMPLINELRSESLKDRHWSQVRAVVVALVCSWPLATRQRCS